MSASTRPSKRRDSCPQWPAVFLLAVLTLPACQLDRIPPDDALASSLRQEITPEGLRRHAEAIVEHERPSGSAGENLAIDYIVRTLQEDGIPVEVHTFPAYASDPIEASIEVVGSDLDLPSITFSFSASIEQLEADLRDLGSSDQLPGFERGTAENLVLESSPGGLQQLRGKIALVEGRPSNFTTAKLELMGAAGVIFINPDEWLNDLIVTTTWGSPSLRNVHRIPRIPVAQLKKSDGEKLRQVLGRGPIRIRLHTRVETGWKPLRLAVARIEPASPSAPYVLFGGHIDAWYHGGTDEGASNAAMLELARLFHRHRSRLRRGLVVAWWPGHSNARYAGSTWFADHYFDELRTRAVAYLNIDGVGQTGAKRFSATATASMAGLARDVLGPLAGAEVRVGRPGRNSDQSFNGIGLPLLQINHTRLSEDGGYWWWHRPEDTFDKIDFEILETDTELYGETLLRLLSSPALPVDLASQVRTLGDALRQRQESAGEAASWFEPALERQQALLEIVSRLEADNRSRPDGERDLARIRILRPILRVLYVPFNNYHPDSGVESSLLPGLSPTEILGMANPGEDRYGLALPMVRRELNRVLEALDEALAEARRL